MAEFIGWHYSLSDIDYGFVLTFAISMIAPFVLLSLISVGVFWVLRSRRLWIRAVVSGLSVVAVSVLCGILVQLSGQATVYL